MTRPVNQSWTRADSVRHRQAIIVTPDPPEGGDCRRLWHPATVSKRVALHGCECAKPTSHGESSPSGFRRALRPLPAASKDR